MRRETLDRAVLPVVIPLAAIICIVFFVFFFSRILLAVEPIYATLIALGMSLNVLTACALVAALPRLRTAIVVGAIAIAAVLLGGAGVLAMAVSPEARLALGEDGAEQVAEGGAHPATPGGGASPGEQGGGGGGGPECEPSGTALAISAPPGASGTGFEATCLAAPADRAFTVELRNDDSVVHNWALYRDPSATEHLGGGSVDEPIAGGQSETYDVDALEAGRYFYRCDFHPTTMTGTLVVE
ncbi:MAG: cupredoxin domain-containing protein [Actinomycetota bacterium]